MNDPVRFSESDHRWMQLALRQAQQAAQEGEVPVGAVIVHQGQVVGEGRNQCITLNDPSAHAEITALRAAGLVLENYRLPGCEMYVTLEPCAMCAAAVIHARLDRVCFGATDPKTGAIGGAYDLPNAHPHNHQVVWDSGLMGQECSDLLTGFFRERRRSGS